MATLSELGGDRDVLGLEPDRVRLRPYTSRWPQLFAVEAAAIRTVLGPLAVDVQHVGSTSIPGLMAKPILDIAVALEQLCSYPLCIARLAALGYEHVPWQGLARNEVFAKGAPRTHLLHVVEHGGDKWQDYLKFRERLASVPGLAHEYESLKLALASTHALDRAGYTAAKHTFIRGVLDAP
jgi:GrpB-like predicted nucleotidyltransferase (UPF0157 family)